MARPTKQDKNWNFTVLPNVQLLLPNHAPSGVFANVRSDTNQVVGVVSENGYGMVQNSEFVDTLRGSLAGLGLTGYKEDIISTQAGRRLFVTYTFDNRVKALHKVGDNVGLVLRFRNSFDGKTSAMAELMARILRCLNGCVLEQSEFALQQRHHKTFNLNFVQEVISRAVSKWDEALAMFDRLSTIAISDEQGINILKHLAPAERMREAIQALWLNPNFAQERGRNLYSLYSVITEVLRDVENDRLEYAARINRGFLRGIVSATDPEKLKAFSLPPVIEAEVITQQVIVAPQ